MENSFFLAEIRSVFCVHDATLLVYRANCEPEPVYATNGGTSDRNGARTLGVGTFDRNLPAKTFGAMLIFMKEATRCSNVVGGMPDACCRGTVAYLGAEARGTHFYPLLFPSSPPLLFPFLIFPPPRTHFLPPFPASASPFLLLAPFPSFSLPPSPLLLLPYPFS